MNTTQGILIGKIERINYRRHGPFWKDSINELLQGTVVP